MFTYGVYFLTDNMTTLQLFSKHFCVADARKALKEQLDRFSNNENQATANQKDAFHYYIKSDETKSYADQKRGFFVCRIYSNDNKIHLAANLADETACEKFNLKESPYFNFDSYYNAI
jgi:hypothetical protein